MAMRPLESSRTVAEADDAETAAGVETAFAGGAGVGLGNRGFLAGAAAHTIAEKRMKKASAEYRFTEFFRSPTDAVPSATLETDRPSVNRFDDTRATGECHHFHYTAYSHKDDRRNRKTLTDKPIASWLTILLVGRAYRAGIVRRGRLAV